MLAFETAVKNGLPYAIKASNTLQAYGKDLKMDLLVERMKLVLSRKKANMAVKWRAILGIDGGAAPNDGTPHSMLKALELGATAIADFVEAVDKVAAVVKKFVLRSKNHNNHGLVVMINGLVGAGGTCGGGSGGSGAGGGRRGTGRSDGLQPRLHHAHARSPGVRAPVRPVANAAGQSHLLHIRRERGTYL
jgi:hypothetical protein